MFWRRKNLQPYEPRPTNIAVIERVLIGSILALAALSFALGYSWGHP